MTFDLNRIYCEDCKVTLGRMPDESVNCIVTSPPYYGLRDYGCEGQIGLEETPDAYVQKLVDVFRECRRVLKKDGTLWLNLGDSYAGSGMVAANYPESASVKQKSNTGSGTVKGRGGPLYGLKPKDLIGIPWRVAFALQADGWYLRQDIIWHKPNPMPESVTDRCTKAHEYIFLLTKSAKYYYDAEAVKEKSKDPLDDIRRQNQQTWDNKSIPNDLKNGIRPRSTFGNRNGKLDKLHSGNEYYGLESANKRSVWTITTKPFSEAHFATFPEDLIMPCIKAGTKEHDVVYDPFMGAGTTALVALKLNRKFIGSELNPDYVKIANKRIEPELKQLKLL